MITTFLLLIIYLGFISLGLPDGILGVAWPEMRQTFSMPLAGVGILTTIVSIGSVFSSFLSGHILKKFGTGPVVCASCALTGLAMLGFGLSQYFIFLVFLCIPLGIGAGAVDTGLNNYVATHFSSRHMNWLHACWGVGAFSGPLIMTQSIVATGTWRVGYIIAAAVQLTLAVIFLATLKLWKLHSAEQKAAAKPVGPEIEPASAIHLTFRQHIRKSVREISGRKGLLYSMLIFFFYVGSETSVGLWSASYLRTARLVSVENAGLWVSLYYASITVGRVLVGFFVEKIGTRTAVRTGILISIIGFACFLLPFFPAVLCPAALCLIGLGFAPMYPCAMQETPLHFGRDFSQIAIGYQMGLANIGYTILPIIIGTISGATTLWVVPFGALILLVGFIFFYEKLAKIPNAEDLLSR
jgi:fucose permease